VNKNSGVEKLECPTPELFTGELNLI